MLLKEFENKNAEIINIIAHQRELERKLLQIKNNHLKNLSQEADNNKSNSSISENFNSFSNFDLNELEEKVISYGQKIFKKKNGNYFHNKKKNEDLNRKENSINEQFNNYYLNKKQRYDINNRFNLFDIYLNTDYKKNIYLNLNNNATDIPAASLKELFSAEPITFYEIFNFKSIAKNENGLMQNQLILIAKNNSLLAYDIYLNQLGSARFKEKIVSLKTFKNQEGNF